MSFRLSARARRDINKLLRFSLETYGRDAAARYQLLLKVAMEEVGIQPLLDRSRPVKGKPGVRTYSLSHSRLRLPRDQLVLKPVHQLVYRIADDNVVDILAVIGESYPPGRVLAHRSP